jgi:type II secretory pathway pseudopilin PulG
VSPLPDLLKLSKDMKKYLNRLSKIKLGFTMVEIVVAIGVLAVGVVGIAYFFSGSTRMTRSASNTSVAANLAQSVIEEETTKTYDDILTVPKTNFSDVTTDPFYKFSKSVNVRLINKDLGSSSTDLGLKNIEVYIYWNEGNSAKKLFLSTIKAKK